MMSMATHGLSDGQKKYVMSKMAKMDNSGKMMMEKKMGAMSVSNRKAMVSKMMKSEMKMSGDKMSKDKMSGDKMGGKM